MAVLVYLLAILLVVLSIGYFYLKQRTKYWQNRGIANEEPSLLFGNFIGLGTKRSFGETWLDYYNKFRGTGPYCGFNWFQNPGAFILEPFLIKHILIKDFSKFTDRGLFFNERNDPLSANLFAVDGQLWRSLRNKLSSTFTSGKMKFMFPTVVGVAQEAVKVLDQMVKESSIIEVKELLARLTTDIIGVCAFGIECNSLKDPDAEFRIMGKAALNDVDQKSLGFAFRQSFPKLARDLRMRNTPQHVEDFFIATVRQTVAYRESNNIRRNDFMDLLIDLNGKNSLKDENGKIVKTFTIEEMAAHAFVFMLAGFETSSTTMGFALYELARHPEIQQKAREEIIATLKKHDNELTYECINEMQYLSQIISETLRLYTVLPILNRQALEDFDVPGYPKYKIPKGMPVFIPIGGIHRDPEYYPNPNEFDPERFSPEEVKNRDSILFMPFGDGPRNCIGLRFGKMQTNIGLSLLLKDFKFSFCEQTERNLEYDKNNFLIATKNGIFLKVEKV